MNRYKTREKFQTFCQLMLNPKVRLHNALRHRRFHESLHEGIISLQTLFLLGGFSTMPEVYGTITRLKNRKNKIGIKGNIYY